MPVYQCDLRHRCSCIWLQVAPLSVKEKMTRKESSLCKLPSQYSIHKTLSPLDKSSSVIRYLNHCIFLKYWIQIWDFSTTFISPFYRKQTKQFVLTKTALRKDGVALRALHVELKGLELSPDGLHMLVQTLKEFTLYFWASVSTSV